MKKQGAFDEYDIVNGEYRPTPDNVEYLVFAGMYYEHCYADQKLSDEEKFIPAMAFPKRYKDKQSAELCIEQLRREGKFDMIIMQTRTVKTETLQTLKRKETTLWHSL